MIIRQKYYVYPTKLNQTRKVNMENNFQALSFPPRGMTNVLINSLVAG